MLHTLIIVSVKVCVRLQLASIRKLCQELEGRLKAVKVAIVKLQEEVCNAALLC